jgi:cysteinyl-tRNA synthetase
MSVKLLGEHFDIHGGGMDLKFPHHENEIAQTCAACGSKFVNLWMHNGFVRIDDEKMSKSLGNFFTVREVLEWVRDPEVVRYLMIGSHYRGPINYTSESLAQSDAALERLYLALRGVRPVSVAPVTAATERFVAAMDDDFNTPVALSELQSLARVVNTAKAAGRADEASAAAGELLALGSRLGLLGQDPEAFLRKRPKRVPGEQSVAAGEGQGGAAGRAGVSLTDADIDRLIAERAAARKAKDFKESDRIRDELAAAGVLLEDQPGGKTLWRRG